MLHLSSFIFHPSFIHFPSFISVLRSSQQHITSSFNYNNKHSSNSIIKGIFHSIIPHSYENSSFIHLWNLFIADNLEAWIMLTKTMKTFTCLEFWKIMMSMNLVLECILLMPSLKITSKTIPIMSHSLVLQGKNYLQTWAAQFRIGYTFQDFSVT